MRTVAANVTVILLVPYAVVLLVISILGSALVKIMSLVLNVRIVNHGFMDFLLLTRWDVLLVLVIQSDQTWKRTAM